VAQNLVSLSQFGVAGVDDAHGLKGVGGRGDCQSGVWVCRGGDKVPGLLLEGDIFHSIVKQGFAGLSGLQPGPFGRDGQALRAVKFAAAAQEELRLFGFDGDFHAGLPTGEREINAGGSAAGESEDEAGVILDLDLPELAAEMAGGEFRAAEHPLKKIEEVDAGIDADTAAAAYGVGLPAFFVTGLRAVRKDGIDAEDPAVFAGGEKFLEVLDIFQEAIVEANENSAVGFFGTGDEIFCFGASPAERFFYEHARSEREDFWKAFDSGVVRSGYNGRAVFFGEGRDFAYGGGFCGEFCAFGDFGIKDGDFRNSRELGEDLDALRANQAGADDKKFHRSMRLSLRASARREVGESVG